MVCMIFLFSGVSKLLNCHKGFKKPICQKEVGEVQVCTGAPYHISPPSSNIEQGPVLFTGLVQVLMQSPRHVLLSVLTALGSSTLTAFKLVQTLSSKYKPQPPVAGAAGQNCSKAGQQRGAASPWNTAQLSCPGRELLVFLDSPETAQPGDNS